MKKTRRYKNSRTHRLNNILILNLSQDLRKTLVEILPQVRNWVKQFMVKQVARS